MLAGVGGPGVQLRQGRCRVFFQEGADAELGGETLGESVLGLHRQRKVVQPVVRHQRGVGQEQKGRHWPADGFAVWRIQRVQQNAHGLAIVLWQMPAQGARQMVPTRHQLQGVVTLQGVTQKILGVKCRVHRPHHRRDGAGNLGAVMVLEGFCHGCLQPTAAACRGGHPCAALCTSCTAKRLWRSTRGSSSRVLSRPSRTTTRPFTTV